MYRVHQQELSERAYLTLKEMILNNELSSGEKLNQEKLAERLGVSRTPLLSAFSKLEKEMLVELKPRRGAYVKRLSRKEFEDLYDIRMRLEPLGAAEAALNGSAEEIRELKQRLEAFDRQVQAQSNDTIKAADYHFHMTIMRMSRNDLLYRMISSFNIIIIANLEGLLKDPKKSLKEHQKICEAIAVRDAAGAEKCMHEHIYDAKQNLKNMKI